MKITISLKWILLSITIVAFVFGTYAIYQTQLPQVGHGHNTVIAVSYNQQNIPPLGACTGPLGQSKQNLMKIQSGDFTHPVPTALQQLDNLTITCNGPKDIMKLPVTFTNLGGQCCGALTNMTEYNEQLEGLKKFSEIPDIPQNPYNIPVALAQTMTTYDSITSLTSQQQSVLDQASKLAKDGGPCCCKCWHWYFNEGIAKKLIKEHGFTAQQVAEFYDLSDTCGN
jgi:hypothetical protein